MGHFGTKNGSKMGQKGVFPKMIPAHLGCSNKCFLARFERVLTDFSPFHHMYAPLCALRMHLGAVWWCHLELGEGCSNIYIYIYIYIYVCIYGAIWRYIYMYIYMALSREVPSQICVVFGQKQPFFAKNSPSKGSKQQKEGKRLLHSTCGLTFSQPRDLWCPLTPRYVRETAQKGAKKSQKLRNVHRQPETKNGPYLGLRGSKTNSEGT